MQVLVAGMPAYDERSTVVWQYRQSIPSTPTWCSWLNGTGCSRIVPAAVPYEERVKIRQSHIRKGPVANPMTMETRETAFAHRGKTWGMDIPTSEKPDDGPAL